MESVGVLRIAPLSVVKATIAELVLESSDNSLRVGQILLKPHQASAVARIRKSIDEFGGAMLCDPVGTGKTFTALALPTCNTRVAVVAPAVLREMWLQSLAISDRTADFVSFESLSRRTSPSGGFDFVIVDEAHHARNSRTARFAMLSQLAARARVILLTATPIHNRRQDLISLLSLFLGERAASLTKAELSRCVIRRDELSHTISGMPAVDSLEWIRMRNDPRIPELLLSLPPPVPLRDGGDGGALIARSLVRQWASSNAALTGGLKRRLVRAESLAAALADGTRPTRTELLSWVTGEDAVQLGLPGLLATRDSGTHEMLGAVRSHADALRHLLELARHSVADDERCGLIRSIRDAHGNRKIVAFSQYADTVDVFFTALSSDGQVGALTGSGGRVAGGAISRQDALAAFAPLAMGRRPPPASGEIRLLLTTDLVSEGVNLQDAGTVIHLDLPWTAARLEQRLGRVARIGSRHERVHSYAFLPPSSANDIVRIERILQKKMEAAGLVESTFPSLGGWLDNSSPGAADPQVTEDAREILRRWLGVARNGSHVAAAVSSSVNGFLAVAVDGSVTRTIVRLGDEIGDSPQLLRECLRHCEGNEVRSDHDLVATAESALGAWLLADSAMRSARSRTGFKSGVRATAARRLQKYVRRAPPHERARVAARSEQALDILQGNLGAHDEMEIGRLCSTATDADELLDHVIELGRDSSSSAKSGFEVVAMIVLTRR